MRFRTRRRWCRMDGARYAPVSASLLRSDHDVCLRLHLRDGGCGPLVMLVVAVASPAAFPLRGSNREVRRTPA
jgi:hypothetical protein